MTTSAAHYTCLARPIPTTMTSSPPFSPISQSDREPLRFAIEQALAQIGEECPPIRDRELIWLEGDDGRNIDFPWVVRNFSCLHIVTMNPAMVRKTLKQQDISTKRIEIHKSIDASGLDDFFPDFAENPPTSSELAALLIGYLHDPLQMLFGRGCVVVSSHVLGRILRHLYRAFQHSPDLASLAELLSVKHADLLWRLAGPGGCAIWANELTSSRRVAALARPNPDCSALLQRAVRTGNFFFACNPFELADLVNHHAGAELIDPIELLPPWCHRPEANLAVLSWVMIFRRCRVELPLDESAFPLGKFIKLIDISK